MNRVTRGLLCALLMGVAALLLISCAGGGASTPAGADARALMQSAQTALDSGDYAKAVSDFQASLAKGKSMDAYFGLGNTYTRQNKFTEAIAAYNEALKINPNHAPTLSNLGVAYYQQGDLVQAKRSFEKALAVSANDAETYYLLGAAQLQLGEMDAAEKSLQKAVELKPNLPEAHFGLGTLRKLQGRTDDAIKEFETFLSGPPAQDPKAKTEAERMLKELRGQ